MGGKEGARLDKSRVRGRAGPRRPLTCLARPPGLAGQAHWYVSLRTVEGRGGAVHGQHSCSSDPVVILWLGKSLIDKTDFFKRSFISLLEKPHVP